MRLTVMAGCLSSLMAAGPVLAQDEDGAAALAAKLQDPLSSLSALITDNTLGLRAGRDNDETYEVNIQPVYSVPIDSLGITVIPRAMIPIVSVKTGSEFGRLNFDGDDVTVEDDTSRETGLSDIATQIFITPQGQGDIKFGGGPMFSLRTRTDDDVQGAGWGAGPVGVVVGGVGPISGAVLGGHLWGFDGDFSTTFVQPMLWYNIETIPGAYLGYNNTISFDHKGEGSNSNNLTFPLGLTGGRTFDVGGGHGFDISLGGYHMPSFGRTSGGTEYQVKLGMTWVFPR